MSDVELIKSRLDIADIISEYIELRPAGANMKARCPFHDERSPSFMVHRGRQIFHCFGCGEKGDIFTFLQKIENLDFREALSILAARAGVTLTHYKPEQEDQKSRLKNILKTAEQYFISQLKSDLGTEPLRYLTLERKISLETLDKFGVGLALPGFDNLTPKLRSMGFSEEDIISSGLSLRSERGTVYDRFRERIMFPIRDRSGATIGFTGRLLPGHEHDEKSGGKYVNTPETLVFKKAYTLFDIDLAASQIKKENFAIFMEGQMDVIASHDAGLPVAVASSGTALTIEQLQFIRRFSQNIVFALDSDAAGQTALRRAVMTAWAVECTPYVVPYAPDAKDPADIVKANPRQWINLVGSRLPAMEHFILQESKKSKLNTAEEKKAAAQSLLPLLSAISDPIEKSHYVTAVSELLRVDRASVDEAVRKIKVPTGETHKLTIRKEPSAQAKKIDRHILDFGLALTISFPEHADAFFNEIDTISLGSSRFVELYKNIHAWYTTDSKTSNFNDYRASLTGTLLDDISILELLSESTYGEITPDQAIQEIRRVIATHKKTALRQKLKDIQNRLKIAETQKNTIPAVVASSVNENQPDQQLRPDDDEIEVLAKELIEITSQLRALESADTPSKS